jgi:hypothetical protein
MQLALLLQRCPGIVSLSLTGCDLSSWSPDQLSALLRTVPHLSQLDLSDARLSVAAKARVVSAPCATRLLLLKISETALLKKLVAESRLYSYTAATETLHCQMMAAVCPLESDIVISMMRKKNPRVRTVYNKGNGERADLAPMQ